MRVLVIEDEAQLATAIQSYLKGVAITCDWAQTYDQGLEGAMLYEYDCILLDLTLPGGDGLRILAEIRKNNRETGVIITTARGQLEDRIAGLDLGADDYLPKPFHLAELAARIRSVWRRHNGNGMPTIKSGLLSLEIGRNEVLAKGVPVSLTRTELSLLQFFISNPGRVITKEALAEHLWGPSADSSDSYDSLYSHIKNLRKKLTEIGCASYLDSVYGMGYKWQPE